MAGPVKVKIYSSKQDLPRNCPIPAAFCPSSTLIQPPWPNQVSEEHNQKERNFWNILFLFFQLGEKNDENLEFKAL